MAIHHLAVSVAAALSALQRKCGHCGHQQLVAASKKNANIRCNKCGAQIPPKPKGDANDRPGN